MSVLTLPLFLFRRLSLSASVHSTAQAATTMGVYNPSEIKSQSNGDDASDVKINSVSTSPIDGLQDSLFRTISKTNDLASGAFDRLRDWHGGIGSLLDVFQDETSNAFGRLMPYARISKEPNEIISKGIPSPEIYDECSKAEGLPLWDQHGLWHCLFPKSKIPYDYRTGEKNAFGVGEDVVKELLSREDIEADKDHKYGIFFRNLEDLLGWQASMRRAMEQERQKRMEKFSGMGYYSSPPDQRWGSSTSSEVTTEIRTLDNGDVKKHTVEKITGSDGITRVKETTEILAPNGTVKESTTEEK